MKSEIALTGFSKKKYFYYIYIPGMNLFLTLFFNKKFKLSLVPTMAQRGMETVSLFFDPWAISCLHRPL